MANVEWDARQTWNMGGFKDDKKAIRAKYQASYAHDSTSIAAIMTILAKADETRDLSQAAVPTGMALAADKGLSFLDTLTVGMDRGEAFTVGSDSESSVEAKSRRSTTRSMRPRRRPSPSPLCNLHARHLLHREGFNHDRRATERAGVTATTAKRRKQNNAAIASYMAALGPIQMSLRQNTIGTRRATSGGQNGWPRKWACPMCSATVLTRSMMV